MPAIALCCIACGQVQVLRQSAVLMPFIAERALLWRPCEITPDWGLRSIPTGHAQALCNSVHCPACGMLFLDMRFDADEMQRLYDGYRGEAYTHQREAWEPGYAQRNAQLASGDRHIAAVEGLLRPWLPPRPRILDWGGDTGRNTPLRHEASRHEVFDISGQPLVAGAVSVLRAEPGAHDLVVLSNVLEHVSDPLALLQQVVAVLSPQARLYVEVPFEALMQQAERDPSAWRAKRHWHEHVNFFSPGALSALAARAGLVVLDRRAIEVPGSPGTVQQALVLARQG